MMTATDTRKDARNHLTHKWGKGALIALCYFLIEFAFNLLSSFTENIAFLNLIISIGIMIVSVPISYGLIISFMKLKRDEEVNVFDFLTFGFSEFSRAWSISFSMLGKLIIPIILMVLSFVVLFVGMTFSIYSISSSIITEASSAHNMTTIGQIRIVIGFIALLASSIYSYIKQLSFVLSYNISYDEPNLTGKEVVEKSQSLMNGNRGNYFVLSLSFIGWSLLALLTLGIGYFWLIPYVQVSLVCFYDSLINKSESSDINK